MESWQWCCKRVCRGGQLDFMSRFFFFCCCSFSSLCPEIDNLSNAPSCFIGLTAVSRHVSSLLCELNDEMNSRPVFTQFREYEYVRGANDFVPSPWCGKVVPRGCRSSSPPHALLPVTVTVLPQYLAGKSFYTTIDPCKYCEHARETINNRPSF